jgi:hypothetical protein
MDERIKTITSQLSEAASDASSAFGTLSHEQLNWKPAEKSWSVGQCLEHIIRTDREFDAEFEKLASGTRMNSFWENLSPFSGWCGRFLIKAVSEDSKKAKAPSQAIVPPSEIDADIVKTFVEHIGDVGKQVGSCDGVDRQKTVVTSPFLAVLTYKLDDALTILVEHIKRHIRQAKRVMAAEGFPK